MTDSRADVYRLIMNFIEGTSGKWDWDDFISFSSDDPEIERVRMESITLPDRFPPSSTGYTNAEGLAELRRMAERLLKS